ncbi:response regulator [Streptomyces erythrochromogenes]|uniref:hypothetical protein n=1 Tax=Streptomyces erythrochromogenes TaxID=285574 RepID=UPI0036B9D92F
MPLFWRIFTVNAITLLPDIALVPKPWVTVFLPMTSFSTRVPLARDHALVLSGVQQIPGSGPWRTARSADGAQVAASLQEAPADLAIGDAAMPRFTRLQAARELTRHPIRSGLIDP